MPQNRIRELRQKKTFSAPALYRTGDALGLLDSESR